MPQSEQNLTGYKFKECPLTASIAEELIVELFAGVSKPIKREELIETVRAEHLRRGGAASKSRVPPIVQKALRGLMEANKVTRPSTAHYQVLSNQKADVDGLKSATGIPADEQAQNVFKKWSDKVVGSGSECVYVYYFEAYRKLAEVQGVTDFRHKIGLTGGDPLERALNQASTAMAEKPTIVRIFRTDESSSLEDAFHSVLTLRGKRCDNAPGTEWFITSLAEIDQIYAFICAAPTVDAVQPRQP